MEKLNIIPFPAPEPPPEEEPAWMRRGGPMAQAAAELAEEERLRPEVVNATKEDRRVMNTEGAARSISRAVKPAPAAAPEPPKFAYRTPPKKRGYWWEEKD